MYYTDIVRCADHTLYTGWTTDLKRRLALHNSGRGAKYTRSRRPVTLVYVEPVSYTHLDVYKRKPFPFAWRIIFFIIP